MNDEGHIYRRPFEDIEIDDAVDYFVNLRKGHYQVKTGNAFKFTFSAYLSICPRNFKYVIYFRAKLFTMSTHLKKK